MEDVTAAEARADGVRIAYDDTGTGEPALLLMPGWCANRTVFRRLAPLLAKRRRVLALGEPLRPRGYERLSKSVLPVDQL